MKRDEGIGRESAAAVEEGDLEAVLERATFDLDTDELTSAWHHAEEDSAQAARRGGGHWVLALVVGAAVLATFWDLTLAVVLLVLGALYTLPILLAGASTARRETTRHTLSDALRAHQEREEGERG